MRHRFILSTLFIGFFLTANLSFNPEILAATSSSKTSSSSKQKKNQEDTVVKSEIGLNIPKWGIAVDAVFDPRLDDIVPNYHIVNLVISNRRPETISLNPKNDRWVIVDEEGHKHIAETQVESFNKKAWDKMPDKLKSMIAYPKFVSSGKSVTIDVFIPKSVQLNNFKEVIWKSSHFNKEFSMLTSYEQELSVSSEKEFDTPKLDSGNVNFDQLMQQQNFKTNPSYSDTTSDSQQNQELTTGFNQNNMPTDVSINNDQGSSGQNNQDQKQDSNGNGQAPFNPDFDNVIIMDNNK